MTEESKFQKAFEYAEKMHRGQYRIGGEDYITHPQAVAKTVKDWGYGIDYQLTALFHDLLEDTNASEDEILNLSSFDVLQSVRLLTKYDGYEMSEYVTNIKNNELARVVKAADRLHNLRTAFCTSNEFKKRYIEETNIWYIDLCDEMIEAVNELEKSIEE